MEVTLPLSDEAARQALYKFCQETKDIELARTIFKQIEMYLRKEGECDTA